MSIFEAPPLANDWPSFSLGQLPAPNMEGHLDEVGLGIEYGRIHAQIADQRPSSHHNDYSMPVQTSKYNVPNGASTSDRLQTRETGNSYQVRSKDDSIPRSGPPSEQNVHDTPRASATASPVSRNQGLNDVGHEEQEEDYDDDDDDEITGDAGTDASQGAGEKTAAERRAERRKMKRFRLTHNQTRFLMSEFARQAHPDAGQRERLSREIPGLSPRQVQVWFQNRRAKLKRLTTDDRERMMKSRALPENFDMTQALQSPFNGSGPPQFSAAQAYGTPISSPSYPPSYDSAPSGGMPHNFPNIFTPPGSLSNSENLSPVSTGDERPALMNTSFPINAQNPSYYGARASNFSAQFNPQSRNPRLQLHERMTKSRAESLVSMGSNASPLRKSTSYTGSGLYGFSSTGESTSGQTVTANRASPSDNGSISQRNSFDYNPRGFQSSALARPRPSGTSFPPELDLNAGYRATYNFPTYPNQQQQQQQQQPTQQSSLSPSVSNQIQAHNMPSTKQDRQSSHPPTVYSAPLEAPTAFHETHTDFYNAIFPNPVTQNNLQNLHRSSASNSIEHESYYKTSSEPEQIGDHSYVRSSVGYGNLFSPPQLTPQQQTHAEDQSIYQPTQLQQQQSQSQMQYQAQQQPSYSRYQMMYATPHALPETPITAGTCAPVLKRRRESDDVDGEKNEGAASYSHGRKRSFTVPSGYALGAGAGPAANSGTVDG